MDYRVELDIFNGPLDLLLYLLKRDELDIYDIPIHSITESYLAYLEHLRALSRDHGLDINIAGDFLVMAATLMEIKSATLLPRQEQPETKDGHTSAAQDLSDPRFELVQQLLEYKRLKDNANLLEQQQASHFGRFPRIPVALEGDNEPPPLDMDEVQIWDLLDAFERLMKDIGTRLPKYHEVTYDETPIDLHAADIRDRLKREKKLSLRDLLIGRKNKSEMIGVFLALLELIREKQITVVQESATDDLEILEASEEHKKTFIGASLELSHVDDDVNDETRNQKSESSSNDK
ncbi:MAG: segregation/condensation protein A [Burkholderiales bacterium]|nr:segregation/condensation protein A [Phycisphaerae bacterium]